jgi:hypothetical protein
MVFSLNPGSQQKQFLDNALAAVIPGLETVPACRPSVFPLWDSNFEARHRFGRCSAADIEWRRLDRGKGIADWTCAGVCYAVED